MLNNPFDNRSLYNLYDVTMRGMQPYSDYCLNTARRFKRLADTMDLPGNIPWFSDMQNEIHKTLRQSNIRTFREMTGYFYVFHMITNIYEKPKFNIKDVKLNDDYYNIYEDVVDRQSFCDLIRFRKSGPTELSQPEMLLIAPMSGHHATLLRDTVNSLLPFYDVYITDWKNARDVPLTEGSFDLNDYIEYVISYFRLLGPDLNVMAICQPTVPVLAALALMSSAKEPNLPRCVILLGGPIDTSKSPTAVNELAVSRDDDWFAQNVVSMVPTHFPGAMRLVYPGFMQLSGFMSMNLQRHIESLKKAIENGRNRHCAPWIH